MLTLARGGVGSCTDVTSSPPLARTSCITKGYKGGEGSEGWGGVGGGVCLP